MPTSRQQMDRLTDGRMDRRTDGAVDTPPCRVDLKPQIFPYLHPETSTGVLVVGVELDRDLRVLMLERLRRALAIAFGAMHRLTLVHEHDVIASAVVPSNRSDWGRDGG